MRESLEKLTDRKIIELWYPTQKELEENDIKERPSLNYYICLGKKQLFIRRTKKTYRICARGFIPEASKKTLITRGGFYEILKSRRFERAMREFMKQAMMIAKKEEEKWAAASQLYLG